MRLIHQLMSRFDALWGNLWRREEHKPDVWFMALRQFHFGAVCHAMHVAETRDNCKFPPSLAEFMGWCRAWRVPVDDQPHGPALTQKKSDPETVKKHLDKFKEQCPWMR